MLNCSYDPKGSFSGEKVGGLRDPQIYVIEYPKELEYYNIRSQISLVLCTDFASSRVLVPEAEGGTLSK